jgi:surfeit locus 1 family protein
MALKAQRSVVLLAAAVVVLGTARLGWWQLDRAAQKTAVQEAMARQQALPALALQDLPRDAAAAAQMQHRAVALQGQWRADLTVYLDNRPMNGRVGFYAVTPLLLADGRAVLVQRGWLPRDLQDRSRIVAQPAPAGSVFVQGRLAPQVSRLYELGDAGQGLIRQNLELAAFARETQLPLLPVVVVQSPAPDAANDGLLRDWPVITASVHKNYGYAFQWFALSALCLGLTLWFQWLGPMRTRPTSKV